MNELLISVCFIERNNPPDLTEIDARLSRGSADENEPTSNGIWIDEIMLC